MPKDPYRDPALDNPGPDVRAIFAGEVPGIEPDVRKFDAPACVKLKKPGVNQYGSPKRGA